MRRLSAVAAAGLLALAAASAQAAAPRVAIVAENSGAETTDLLVPLAVLRDAGVDVSVVAVAPGPVSLMPGLTILPDATLADTETPPEIAVVPAMHDPGGAALHLSQGASCAGAAACASSPTPSVPRTRIAPSSPSRPTSMSSWPTSSSATAYRRAAWWRCRSSTPPAASDAAHVKRSVGARHRRAPTPACGQ
jgi:hypothetical protein